MYKKAVSFLVLAGFVFMACSVCVKGMDVALLSEEPAMTISLELDMLEEKAGEMAGEVSGELGGDTAGENSGELGGRIAERTTGESCPETVKEKEGEEITKKAGGFTGETEEKIAGKTDGETQIVRLGKGGRRQTGGEKGLGIVDIAVSGQRIVDYSVLELKYVYLLSEEDLETLLRIVEAEAGNEDEDGKLLVANVVLNRMNSEAFPDTVSEVVFQREKGISQFSPVANGSFYRVKVSEGTVNAVERALMGEDISQGALYFVARKYADSDKVKWFDRSLTYLFKHGGHEFFK